MSLQLIKKLIPLMMAVVVISCTSVVELQNTSPPVSMDPGVLTGELPNGFRYFLRSANGTTDSDRIEVRLVVKTGSLHEREDQLGYAHLLEHMAFRGTGAFNLQEIESLFNSAGLRWGADVNATTHYGATIYRFSLHQKDSVLFPRLFELMAQWLESIEFDPQDLALEKRIVEAEWRERYAARGFVVDPVSTSAYAGSRFADRPPVGDLSSIRAATVQGLKEFWQDNYRYDNTALVVTGSKKPWLLEPAIRQAFLTSDQSRTDTEAISSADIKNGSSIRPGILYFSEGKTVELHSYRDASAEFPELSVNFVSSMPEPVNGFDKTSKVLAEKFSDQLLFNAYTHLVRNRLLKTDQCSAVTLETSLLESGQFVEHVKIRLTEDDFINCLAISSNAVNTTMKTKLTDEEFQGLKQLFQGIAEEIVGRYRNRDASELAENLADAMVSGEVLLSVIDMQKIFSGVVADMDRDTLNARIKDIAKDHRLIYSLRTNQSDPVSRPEMIAAMESDIGQVNAGSAQRQDIRLVYGDLKSDQSTLAIPELISPELPSSELKKPGSIQDEVLVEKVVERDDYHEWKLKNGASAILINDDQFDHFSVTAISAGGYAGTDGLNATAASLLPQFLALNGLDGYASSSLSAFRSGRNIYMEPFVHPLSHGISANGYATDLPAMLTLIGGYFKGPVVLQPQTDLYLRQLTARKPGFQWQQQILSPGIQADNPGTLQVDAFTDAHQQLFGSSEDFVFVFVGSIKPDQLQRELARLAGSESPDISTRLVSQKKLSTTILLNHSSKSAELALVLACEAYDQKIARHDYWELLSDIVETRLRLSIREQHGLVYDIGADQIVSADLLHLIKFSVAPKEAENIQQLLAEVLDSFLIDSVSTDELLAALNRRQRSQVFQPGDYHSASKLYANRWLATGVVEAADITTAEIDNINQLAQCIGSQAGRQVVLNKVDSYRQESVSEPRTLDENALR